MRLLEFEEYCVDCSDPQRGTLLLEQLAQNGFATFSGVNTREELVDFARRLGSIHPHRDADRDGVTVVSPKMERPILGYQGFTSEALTLHTDSSGEVLPPSLMLFYCLKPSEQGGESLVLDAQKLYRRLHIESPETLESLSTPNSVSCGMAFQQSA